MNIVKNTYIQSVLLFALLWIARIFFLIPYINTLQLNSGLELSLKMASLGAICVVPLVWFVKRESIQSPLDFFMLTTDATIGLQLAFRLSLIIICTTLVLFILSSRDTSAIEVSKIFDIGVTAFFLELFFRSFLFTVFYDVFGYIKTNIITSLLFVLFYVPLWVYNKESQGNMIINSISLFLLSYFFGFLLHKTKTVWCGVIVHAVFSISMYLFIV